MRKILSICILLSIGLSSYSQLFTKIRLGALTQTYGIEDKSLFLVNQNNVPDTSKKATGSQVSTFVFKNGSTNVIPVNSAPDSVITLNNGKISKTPVAASGTFGAFTSYATGTAYTLTGSVARVDFTGSGSVDPQIDLTAAGTYILYVQGSIMYNGATFAANQTITVRLRRSNNPSGGTNIANTDQIITVPIMTTYTGHAGRIFLPIVIYTTANSNDQLQVFAGLSALPSVGSVEINQCSVVAIRLY